MRIPLVMFILLLSGQAFSLGFKRPPPIVGGGTADTADPMVIIAAPPSGIRIYVRQLRCVNLDASGSGVAITLNDAATTQLLVKGGVEFTNKIFAPPLKLPIATALTIKVDRPSVVRCSAFGYAAP